MGCKSTILFSTPSLTIQWRPQQAVEVVNRGGTTQQIKKCWNRHNCDLFILPVLLLAQLIWFSLDNVESNRVISGVRKK